ncbi:MAG: hypothetical protein ACE5MI_10745 [Acidimicrobiia bacterium]
MTPDQNQHILSPAEQVAQKYRRESRRLLVAGIILAVAVMAIGIIVVYGFDLTPGMAQGSESLALAERAFA